MKKYIYALGTIALLSATIRPAAKAATGAVTLVSADVVKLLQELGATL